MEFSLSEILKIVESGGSLVVLAASIFMIGIPLVKGINSLSKNVERTLDKIEADNHRAEIAYMQIAQIRDSLLVAFTGSTVDSYRGAARILREEVENE